MVPSRTEFILNAHCEPLPAPYLVGMIAKCIQPTRSPPQELTTGASVGPNWVLLAAFDLCMSTSRVG